jgi:hypothetical protein
MIKLAIGITVIVLFVLLIIWTQLIQRLQDRAIKYVFDYALTGDPHDLALAGYYNDLSWAIMHFWNRQCWKDFQQSKAELGELNAKKSKSS